jgi:disulfide bond formation protein DsbB
MSAEFINTTNILFSIGTVIFQVVSLILIIGLISRDRGPIFAWMAKNTLWLVFLVSLAGMIGSLIYQYVIGYPPCMWCWYQRIVMYPIAILSFTAIVKKKATDIFDYSLILSIIGAIFAAFHLTERFIGNDLTSCEAFGPSCLELLVNGFGYIDIPVMSFTFFVLMILLLVNKRRFTKV